MLRPISEILAEVNSKNTNEDKLEVLNSNNSKTLRFVLQAAFDNNVQTLLPDGEPPFNPVASEKQVTLNEYVSELPKIFKYGPMHKAPLTKVEFFFMDMLSKLTKEEAKLAVVMKDKRLQSMYKKITKPLVKEFLSFQGIEIK